MKMLSHGLSIGLEMMDDQVFVALKPVGKLTHSDYEAITPSINALLDAVKDPKVKAIFDVTELDGWEPRAAWDDFKLGLKHGKVFEKVAIYGNRKWQSWAAKFGDWFIPGEMKYFEDRKKAIDWLVE